MLARLGTTSLATLVALATIVQLTAPGSGFIAVISGLWLVLGGTLVTARLSHSGSALKALECGCGKEGCASCQCVTDLMDAVDSFVPMPVRDVDKPFLMPVEDVFSISGRGTVVTGRIERGEIKVGEKVQSVADWAGSQWNKFEDALKKLTD